jgi:hypothetical protein
MVRAGVTWEEAAIGVLLLAVWVHHASACPGHGEWRLSLQNHVLMVLRWRCSWETWLASPVEIYHHELGCYPVAAK